MLWNNGRRRNVNPLLKETFKARTQTRGRSKAVTVSPSSHLCIVKEEKEAEGKRVVFFLPGVSFMLFILFFSIWSSQRQEIASGKVKKRKERLILTHSTPEKIRTPILTFGSCDLHNVANPGAAACAKWPPLFSAGVTVSSATLFWARCNLIAARTTQSLLRCAPEDAYY